MYMVRRENIIKKTWQYADFDQLKNLVGFNMETKSHKFTIDGENINNIVVIDKKLARPLVVRVVSKKYNKLIMILTDLLTSDDDSGDALREVLDRIEKFRQEIKNKYRMFLEAKELELMAKQLKALQEEAKLQFVELQNSYINVNENGKNR